MLLTEIWKNMQPWPKIWNQ